MSLEQIVQGILMIGTGVDTPIVAKKDFLKCLINTKTILLIKRDYPGHESFSSTFFKSV